MLKTILGLFGRPLGQIINNAISAGSGAATLWAVSKGVPGEIITPIMTSLVFALSAAISGFAATQGVQIPIINQDNTNGVRVVNSDDAKAAGLPKVDAPIPKP